MVAGTQTRPQVSIDEQPAVVTSLATRPRVSMNELRVLLREKMLDQQRVERVEKPPGNFTQPPLDSPMVEHVEPQNVHPHRDMCSSQGHRMHPQMHRETAELDDSSMMLNEQGVFNPQGHPMRPPIHRGTIDVVCSRGSCEQHDVIDTPGHFARPNQNRMINEAASSQSARDPRDTRKPPGQFACSGMFEEEGFQNVRDDQGISRPQGRLNHPWRSGGNAQASSFQGPNGYQDLCQLPGRSAPSQMRYAVIEAMDPQGVHEPPGRFTQPRRAPGSTYATGQQSPHDYQDHPSSQGHFVRPQASRTPAEGSGSQGARNHQGPRSPPARAAFPQEGRAAFEATDCPNARRRRGANLEPPPARSHPQINSAIIRAADSQNMSLLLQTVEAHLPNMNIVNIATSMYRCGKLAADSPGVRCKSAPTVTKLVAAAQSSLQALQPGDCPTQAISNIAWSLASLQRQERELLPLLARIAVAGMRSFKHIELSSMLWAFAKLGADRVMPAVTQELFYTAAEGLVGVLGELPMRTLSTISWAFATAKQDPNGWFWTLAMEIRRKANEARPQEVSNVVWAFGTAGYKDTAMLDALGDSAMQQVHKFKAQEVSNTLWGFAANAYYHPAFFRDSILQTKRMELNSQHLANMLWACTRVRPRHTATREALTLLVPRCTDVMATMKPQECASVLLAIAKVFGCAARKRPAMPSLPAGPEEGQCPPEVLQFCHAAEHWATSRMSSFSAQSLVNVISACAALGLSRLAGVTQTEVLHRSLTLQPSGLVALLRGLMSNPGIPFAVVCPVAKSLARSFPTSPGDVSSLSRLFMSQQPERVEEPSRPELLEWCVQLSLGNSPCARAAVAGMQAHFEGEDCWAPQGGSGSAESAVYRVKNTFVECPDEEIAAMRTEANFFSSAPPVVRKEERVPL